MSFKSRAVKTIDNPSYPDEPYRIKKVMDGQIQAEAGMPVNLLQFQLELADEEDRVAAARERLRDNPEAALDGMNFARAQQEAVIKLGLLYPKVKPDAVPFDELADDEVHLSMLADDFQMLHDAILDFSNSKLDRFTADEVAELQRFPEPSEGDASSTDLHDGEGAGNVTVSGLPDSTN